MDSEVPETIQSPDDDEFLNYPETDNLSESDRLDRIYDWVERLESQVGSYLYEQLYEVYEEVQAGIGFILSEIHDKLTNDMKVINRDSKKLEKWLGNELAMVTDTETLTQIDQLANADELVRELPPVGDPEPPVSGEVCIQIPGTCYEECTDPETGISHIREIPGCVINPPDPPDPPDPQPQPQTSCNYLAGLPSGTTIYYGAVNACVSGQIGIGGKIHALNTPNEPLYIHALGEMTENEFNFANSTIYTVGKGSTNGYSFLKEMPTITVVPYQRNDLFNMSPWTDEGENYFRNKLSTNRFYEDVSSAEDYNQYVDYRSTWKYNPVPSHEIVGLSFAYADSYDDGDIV